MARILGLILAVASVASARSVFSSMLVEGVDQGHANGIRVPTSNNAIKDVTSNDLICNTNFIQPVSTDIIDVPAGTEFTAVFHRTSAGYTGPDPADPLDPTDKGPITAYLAAIPDATQSDVTGLEWFKIFEDGLKVNGYQWGSDRLFLNNGSVSFTIPTCITDGDYLLRAEYIGLQSAYVYPGAEFYMSCAQIHVSGGDASVTPETVSFPGAYSSSDPGVVTTIFGLSSYTVPGPAPLAC